MQPNALRAAVQRGAVQAEVSLLLCENRISAKRRFDHRLAPASALCYLVLVLELVPTVWLAWQCGTSLCEARWWACPAMRTTRLSGSGRLGWG